METKRLEKRSGKVTNLEVLARRLEKDIRRKGLMPGDKYLIAKDAASLLDVSVVTAHRAMKVLADKKILVRQPKSGTFVGPGFKFSLNSSTQVLKVVHVMMAADYHRTSHVNDKVFVEGVNAVLPRAAVQIHFVPEYDPLGYSEHIISQIKASQAREGLIFIRSSKQVQQYIENSGVISTVFGSVYPGVTKLPSLDVNQAQLGKVMAEYLLERGYRKFAVLMHHEWRRGDNVMLSSIIQSLGDAGIGMDSFDMYSIPFERNIVDSEMQEVLDNISEPTGIFCREDCYAESLLEAMEERGLKLGKDAGIISGGHVRRGQRRSYPYTEPTLDVKVQIKELVKMMCELAMDKQPDPMRMEVPVVIHGA